MDYSITFKNIVLHPLKISIQQGTKVLYACVAHDPGGYMSRTPRYKIVKKFLHKFLSLVFFNQTRLLRTKVSRSARILFLYTGKDSFGDANLELSGRALLKNLGISIDLLTLPKLSQQFKEDDIFQHIYTDINQVDAHKYNMVLMAEFNHRSLRLKRKYLERTPFACLFGYFDGPARNQACFSYAAVNDLFDLGLTDAAILTRAKPYLSCQENTTQSVADMLPTEPFIALSIGGIDPYRTYSHWPDLLCLLDADAQATGLKQIVLIGSENGALMATALCSRTYSSLKITSLVGNISLLQTRAVIARAQLFIGCDGGLMHVAHSTQTPSVTFFSKKEPHQYWLTEACQSNPIQSLGAVSEITPHQIMTKIRAVIDLRKR